MKVAAQHAARTARKQIELPPRESLCAAAHTVRIFGPRKIPMGGRT